MNYIPSCWKITRHSRQLNIPPHGPDQVFVTPHNRMNLGSPTAIKKFSYALTSHHPSKSPANIQLLESNLCCTSHLFLRCVWFARWDALTAFPAWWWLRRCDGLELGCPGGACVFLVSRIDRGNGNGESGHGAEWSVCLCVGNGQGKGILGILILQMWIIGLDNLLDSFVPVGSCSIMLEI